MSTVFVSKRSQFGIVLLKGSFLATSTLALALLIMTADPATVNPTVKPVLALSDQENELIVEPTPEQLSNETPGAEILLADPEIDNSNAPDDTYVQQQWSLQNNPSIDGASGLFGSHEFLTSPTEIVVAVVDSGVMLEHEDLNFLPGYDFIHEPGVGNDGDGRDHDPSDPGDWVSAEDVDQQLVNDGCPLAASKWHGTAISGIISATSNNATGIAGGSPSVAMLPVRVTGKCGGYVSDLIDGIRWAAGLTVQGVADNQNPADVINLSVGFPGSCSNAMQTAINEAVAAGAVLVTASTNSAANLDIEPYSPASCENIITVAATDRAGAMTNYTALGETVFMSAPGGTVTDGIITTQNDGYDRPVLKSSYGYHYGTSIAAAHVSSAIANLLSYKPDLTKPEIEQLLSVSATPTDFDPACRSGQCGEGRLDAYAAMELLVENYLLEPEEPLTVAAIPVQPTANSRVTSATDTIVTSTSEDEEDEIWAGAVDWKHFLLLVLILSLRSHLTRKF